MCHLLIGPSLTGCEQMRLLYGRHGPSSEPIKFATFSVDEEYKQNEMDRESGLAQEAKPVRTVAPGRHQLQSLLNGECSFWGLWFGSSGTAGSSNIASTPQLPNHRRAPWKRALPVGNPIARRLLRGMAGDPGRVEICTIALCGGIFALGLRAGDFSSDTNQTLHAFIS